jgi:hypothetical protein
MRRPLLLFLLTLAAPAYSVQMVLPGYPTGEAQQIPTGAKIMTCGRFINYGSATGLTTTLVNVTTGFGGGAVVGWAIYPDLDAGTAIMSTGNNAAAVSSPVTATVSAFSLTAGLTYRLCFCATNATGAYAAPHWTASTGVALLLNSFVASVGTAANQCDTSANPPGTTGAISANSALAPPLVVVQ